MGVPISSYPHTHGGVDKHFLKVTTIHLNLTIYQLRWITHLRWRVREKRKSYSTAIVSFREMLQSFSLTGICICIFFWDSIFFTMYLSECVFFLHVHEKLSFETGQNSSNNWKHILDWGLTYYAPLVIPPPLINFFRSKSGGDGKYTHIHLMVLPGSQVDLL